MKKNYRDREHQELSGSSEKVVLTSALATAALSIPNVLTSIAATSCLAISSLG